MGSNPDAAILVLCDIIEIIGDVIGAVLIDNSGAELADIIGISEPTMCRWMRKELPEDEQRLIIAKIEDHAKEAANAVQ